MNLKISPLAYINKIKDDYVVGFGSKQDIIDEILYNKIKGLLSYIDVNAGIKLTENAGQK